MLNVIQWAQFARLMVVLTLMLLTGACSDPVLLAPEHILPDGGVYQGQTENGLFHGKGTLKYPDGRWYKGEFKQGMMEGRGAFYISDATGSIQMSYTGDFSKGMANGLIAFIDESSQTEYRGEMRHWKYHGMGVIKTPDRTYSGEFEDGVFSGQGILNYINNNSRYAGGFKNSLFHGHGLYTAGKSSYQGVFEQGALTGPGSYIDVQGSTYLGELVDWVSQGHGTQTDSDGNTYTGEFENGYLNGKGTFTGVDGSHYEGGFRYGRYDGEGTLVLADQSRYIGHFQNGQYHGNGTLTTPALEEIAEVVQKGRWYKGRWVYNDVTQTHIASQAEIALEQHQRLLESMLAALLPTDSTRVNGYFLGVAGDGTQSVFRREIEYVRHHMQQHYGTHDRSMSLINHHDSAAEYPLATPRAFSAAIKGIATKMDTEKDVLFLYLSSHGSRQHALKVAHDSIELPPMSAQFISETIRNSGIKWKVVFVSACYAGGFIDELDDGNTVILAASDAKSTSFGCSEESEMTYFGKALFKHVLAENPELTLKAAFESARALIQQWEQEEQIDASNPVMKHSAPLARHLTLFAKQRQ